MLEGPLLSAELLAPVVRRALDAPGAWPSEWSCEPLDWQIINPSTAGLYRVVGTAEMDPGPPRPWRVVLKILHLPDLTGTPVESGYIDQPEDWNYWKREVLARRSGIPDRFSWPLRPVRCWGTEDVDDTTAWLWLEELDTSPRRVVWSLPELADAAYDWGAFAAQGVAIQADVQCERWAARKWVRGWVGSFGALGADHALAHEGCWRHPLVRERLPVSARAVFVRLMAAADLLLDRLDALPPTVAHHDTQWNNLFQEAAREGRGTVAIDWGFFGTAPIGEDLGHHIGLNVFLGAVKPHDADEHERTATKAYLDGLDAFGWRGNIDDVRFAAVAAGALQMLPIAACHLADLCPEFGEVERWPDDEAKSQKSSVEGVMDTWCEAFRYLMTLGERACAFVGR